MLNKIVTFVENKNKTEKDFNGTEIVFSIPQLIILEAEEFCQREQLEYCYVVYSSSTWLIQTSCENFLYYIKVTAGGISAETKEEYIYDIKDANDS